MNMHATHGPITVNCLLFWVIQWHWLLCNRQKLAWQSN